MGFFVLLFSGIAFVMCLLFPVLFFQDHPSILPIDVYRSTWYWVITTVLTVLTGAFALPILNSAKSNETEDK